MAVRIEIKEGYPMQEVNSIIKSALTRDAHIAVYKKEKYLRMCKRFEKKYNLDSDEFMDKLESGKLDDSDDFFYWYAAKKGFDIQDRRLRILAGVNM